MNDLIGRTFHPLSSTQVFKFCTSGYNETMVALRRAYLQREGALPSEVGGATLPVTQPGIGMEVTEHATTLEELEQLAVVKIANNLEQGTSLHAAMRLAAWMRKLKEWHARRGVARPLPSWLVDRPLDSLRAEMAGHEKRHGAGGWRPEDEQWLAKRWPDLEDAGDAD